MLFQNAAVWLAGVTWQVLQSALTIPVETKDRGGYSIGCEIVDTYFMGGLGSAAKLAVTEVRRRKPYRAKDRAPADAVVEIVEAQPVCERGPERQHSH